ncbi:flagellar basal body rod protein FlgG [Alkalihalobacillus sp. LMS39]|uniref:flagellar basal body rod protein FlgG n=1 Tax=Alkalihalobacillus sp. LMS39 TaxID=2924032 RepID=UPI001FB3DB51|nr:flagellar basal body rod protein FlgG [Alkalihalobacillus sp. LMS39]UOE92833.1 flagellar basal body rod protein FlgG [Alkalihalobacillus sp. LMS39]
MLRSMYSGISGMKNFQVKLDVIGNNIANVNTFGYKKGRTTFSDLMSQQLAGATAPGDNRGGMNPRQVGLGSQLATIDTIGTQGSLQTTGRQLDLGISGDGFFEVQDGAGNSFYTRAGNFYLDENGSIVNSNGLFLVGMNGQSPLRLFDPDQDQTINDVKSFSIGSDGKINVVNAEGELMEMGQIGLVKFNNPDGLEKSGGNIFIQSANSGDPLPMAIPGEQGAGLLFSGALEMSNVDLSEEFTEMIVAQRGFQANTRMITTSDEILQEIMQMKR